MPIKPPDDLGDSPEEAWLHGFEAACHLVRARVGELSEEVATAEDGDDGADTDCPSCGTETVRVLGGRRCPDCGEVV